MTTQPAVDLDAIILEIGETGRYRSFMLVVWSVLILLTSLANTSYLITSSRVEYRCAIPQCEHIRADRVAEQFAPEWMRFAIPDAVDNTTTASVLCKKYRWLGDPNDVADADRLVNCKESMFDTRQLDDCTEFVFEYEDAAIMKTFGITCENSEWRLTLIGTLYFVACSMMMPFYAIMSDRYGRRPVLIASILFGSCFGLLKSLSVNYIMFASMEFITSMATSGTFMSIFVMSIESSGPGQRLLMGTWLSAVYSFAQAMAAILASQVHHLSTLLQLLFVPGLFGLALLWLVPESVRWLLANQQVHRARHILMRAAKINGVQLSVQTHAVLREHIRAAERKHAEAHPLGKHPEHFLLESVEYQTEAPPSPSAFRLAVRSRTLMLRLSICLFLWFTNSFVYYGMNAHSVVLDGSKYSNYIMVNLVEVPAIFVAYYLMSRFGRKRTLSVFLAINAVACLGTEFLVANYSMVRTLLYFVGKSGVTTSYTVLFIYTSEMFPTAMRQTFMNSCSSFSAIGSVLAQQVPLLAAAVWAPLPMLLFGGTAMMASGLVLLLPETLNRRLPDTVEDAERIDGDDTNG